MASSARIDELRKKFEENPRRYFAPLANEYRKAGDIDQAISICREYLPQQPGHMSGHIVYGQALYEARQYEEARTVFETALALDPENLIALRHLGDIALIVGDIENARTWYGRVLEADPRNEEIQAQLRSLDAVTSSEPTPMSAPAVQPPTQAADAAPPADLPAVPLSSAPTVVVAAMPMPAIERTVELPMTAVPSPAPESLSTTPTAEITVDSLPVPAVPDLEKLTPADASSAELPVEKASGFEATAPASASEELPIPQAAGLETTAAAPTEVPPLDSFTLEGLESTAMGSAPAAASAPPPAGEPAPVPASEPEPVPDLELAMPASEPAAESKAPPAGTPPEASVSSSELSFLDVGETTAEAKHEAVAANEPPVPAELPMAESKPFVTETMAELYEQQGHRDEALRVYRALREQRPNDDHIRARIEQLEGKRGPTIRDLLSRVAARRPQVSAAPSSSVDGAGTAAVAGSQIASAALSTSEPVSIASAATETPAPPERAPEPPAAGRSARSDMLGQLFDSPNVSGADETAAVTLAAAFSSDRRDNGGGGSLAGAPARPASKDLSLDAVFGAESATPPASSFSFDQFFSQRATAEQPVAGKPGVEGGGAGQETKDDVAKFTQWLEGLKQR